MTIDPTPYVETLPDGSYLIRVNGRSSIVSSAHLIEERILRLKRMSQDDQPQRLETPAIHSAQG